MSDYSPQENEVTLPSLNFASNPVDDDLLYLVQGTGEDRDRKLKLLALKQYMGTMGNISCGNINASGYIITGSEDKTKIEGNTVTIYDEGKSSSYSYDGVNLSAYAQGAKSASLTRDGLKLNSGTLEYDESSSRFVIDKSFMLSSSDDGSKQHIFFNNSQDNCYISVQKGSEQSSTSTTIKHNEIRTSGNLYVSGTSTLNGNVSTSTSSVVNFGGEVVFGTDANFNGNINIKDGNGNYAVLVADNTSLNVSRRLHCYGNVTCGRDYSIGGQSSNIVPIFQHVDASDTNLTASFNNLADGGIVFVHKAYQDNINGVTMPNRVVIKDAKTGASTLLVCNSGEYDEFCAIGFKYNDKMYGTILRSTK